MALSEERIAWVDVESTGLTPEHDTLLEIACLVTDTDLNVLDEHGYQAVVYYPQTYVDILKTQTDSYVLDMHTKTGLWDRLSDGKPLADLDTEILAYLHQFAPQPRTAYLGGNSITLDRNFINTYLPKFGQHLHYRSIDVTTIAKLAQWWEGKNTMYHKKTLHSAFDDILESIEELKFHRNAWLQPDWDGTIIPQSHASHTLNATLTR